MRHLFLSIAVLATFAASANAQEVAWKADDYRSAPQGYSMSHQVMTWAEARKPSWADEQKGYVGWRPENSRFVFGGKVEGRPMLGFSAKW